MRAALFSTCTAQAYHPTFVKSMLSLAERLGFQLDVPRGQTCCGLPMWNAGLPHLAAEAAHHLMQVFAGYDLVLTSSPSCDNMIHHFPGLMVTEEESHMAQEFIARCCDLATFLERHAPQPLPKCQQPRRVLYFASCSQGDLNTTTRLLEAMVGADQVICMDDRCCGYGNNLSWTQPKLSSALAGAALAGFKVQRVDRIVTDDVGCLVHLTRHSQSRSGAPIMHLAEFVVEVLDSC